MTLAVALMGLTAANAQLVVGGSIGLGGNIGSDSKFDGELESKMPNRFNFEFAPRIGYQMMDDKMELGLSLNLNYHQTTNFGDGITPVVSSDHKKAIKTSASNSMYFGVCPYVRYFFLQRGIFSLGIQANINLGGDFMLADTYYAYKGEVKMMSMGESALYKEVEVTKDEAKKSHDARKEAIKDSKYSNFQYGISVVPVIKLDLTEYLYMDIAFNAAQLYLNGSTTSYIENAPKLSEEAKDIKVTQSSFDAGIQGFCGSALSIGFAYKF